MGLDILLRSDKNIYSSHEEEAKYRNKHSLSRTFCNFMYRGNVVQKPELDQIGKLLKLDIYPLYDMENYTDDDDDWLDFMEFDSEDEKNASKAANNTANEALIGNIDKVTYLINQLIIKLSVIPNLPELLDDNEQDILDNNDYFSNFNKDTGDGYIGNNLGQDLRNFMHFLEFAKSKQAETVWFSIG
jgi:hypothetical protein